MKQSEARFMAVKCALSSVKALYFTALFKSLRKSGVLRIRLVSPVFMADRRDLAIFCPAKNGGEGGI
ncbi:MAG TPA: hypothetical protein PKN80_05400, partial [bacterium]|nr:hypothetical protein [bacterium]HNS49002.1 hypothetical protein [bacterium]